MGVGHGRTGRPFTGGGRTRQKLNFRRGNFPLLDKQRCAYSRFPEFHLFQRNVILRQFLIIGDSHTFTASQSEKKKKKNFAEMLNFYAPSRAIFFFFSSPFLLLLLLFFFRLLIIRQVDARGKGREDVRGCKFLRCNSKFFFISYRVLFFRLLFRLLLIRRRNPLLHRFFIRFFPFPGDTDLFYSFLLLSLSSLI